MTCHAELCHHWTGQGCACEFLGLEPNVACGRDPWCPGQRVCGCEDEEGGSGE